MAHPITAHRTVVPATRGGGRRTSQPQAPTKGAKRPRLGVQQGDETALRVDALLAKAREVVLRDPVACVRLASEAQMLARGFKYTRGIAEALRLQGFCDIWSGHLDRARDLLSESVALAEAAGRGREELGAAASFLGLGRALVSQEQEGEALEILEQAIRRAHRCGSKEIEAEATLLQGECYALRGDHERAMEQVERGMKIVDDVSSAPLRALAFLSAAKIRASAGTYSRAMLLVRRGGRIAREEGISVVVCRFDLLGGTIRATVGDDAGAMSRFSEAAATALAIENHTVVMESCAGITSLFRKSGDDRRSIEYATQRLELARTIASRYDVASSLNTLGNIYYRMGDLEQALRHYAEAATEAAEGGRPDVEEVCLENMGNVHRDMGEFDAAVECYTKSRRIASARKNRATTASCYFNLGLLSLDRSDYTAAIQHLNTAAIAAEAVGDDQLLAQARRELSRAFESRNNSGDIARAFEHFRAFHRSHESVLMRQRDHARDMAELRSQIDRAELEDELSELRMGSDRSSTATQTIGPIAQEPSNDLSEDRGATEHTGTSLVIDAVHGSAAHDGVNGASGQVVAQADREEIALRRGAELREVDGRFVDAITQLHPDISPGELRVLLFLRTGMSTAEIAAFVGVTERAIEKHRYKVRAKMRLPKHINLSDYVRTMAPQASHE